MAEKIWKHIVLDTSAFIQGEIEQLRTISSNLWTLKEVLQEVKDFKAKQNLEFALDVIPENINLIEPNRKSVDYVIGFTKQTGDFPSLSKTDILVLAATFQLSEQQPTPSNEDAAEYNEKVTTDRTKPTSVASIAVASTVVPGRSWASITKQNVSQTVDEPATTETGEEEKKPEVSESTLPIGKGGKHVMWNDEDFEIEGRKKPVKETVEEWPSLPASAGPVRKVRDLLKPSTEPSDIAPLPSVSPLAISSSGENDQDSESQEEEASDDDENSAAEPEQSETPNHSEEQLEKRESTSKSRILSMNSGISSSVQQMDEDEVDGLEWAKPGSISTGWVPASGNRKQRSTFGSSAAEVSSTYAPPPPPACSVGCSTADYACQNVLLQLKLGVISLDGRRITQVKNWVLKCDSCLRMFPATEHRLFCPHCGHNTLSRLAYSVDAQGNRRYHYSKSRRIKTQGNVYSIPKNADILLREDQLLSGIWAQRAQKKTSSVSMFGEDVNDAMGLSLKGNSQIKVGFGSQNPNAKKGRERRGAKKKNKA
jgi:RNA-binding protein NOB1